MRGATTDGLHPTVTPDEVGVDAARLRRVDDLLHRYVDDGQLPGTAFLLARHGQIVHHDLYGWADVEDRRPLRDDAIYRMYSLTKPIVSVALMMLHEQGRVLLEDPIERYLPAFAQPRVYVSGNALTLRTRPAARSIRVGDLLTHTAGLSYGINQATTVDELYREHDLGVFGTVPTYTNAEMVELIAALPLQHDPGARWLYSMGTDVVGALVEVLADQPLGAFLREHVYGPLGMVDTDFWVPPSKLDRLTTSYLAMPDGLRAFDRGASSTYATAPTFESGGGGLVSTMADYLRFAECMRGGGVLGDARLLSPRTVRFMASNHLPGGRTLAPEEHEGFQDPSFAGMGFGLGVAVNVDPVQGMAPGSPGDFGWSGSASTSWICDPVEDLTILLLTQLIPDRTYPLRRQLRATVHQALLR